MFEEEKRRGYIPKGLAISLITFAIVTAFISPGAVQGQDQPCITDIYWTIVNEARLRQAKEYVASGEYHLTRGSLEIGSHITMSCDNTFELPTPTPPPPTVTPPPPPPSTDLEDYKVETSIKFKWGPMCGPENVWRWMLNFVAPMSFATGNCAPKTEIKLVPITTPKP